MPPPELVTIQAHIKKDTDKAILIDFQGEEAWIPKSQIEDMCFDFDPPKISMTSWIAKQKGII